MLDHCDGRQLRELLALASTNATTARDWLLEVGDWDQIENALTGIPAGAWRSVDELLRAVCSPDTPVDDLMIVKSAAKRSIVAAEAANRKAAATLLYHLAVASALAHHARNISSHDPAARLSLYKELAAEISDDNLAGVFKRAAARISAGSL